MRLRIQCSGGERCRYPTTRQPQSPRSDPRGALYPILVAVLAAQDPLAGRVGQVIPRRRDVDEETTLGIDPPRVDDIQLIGLLSDFVVRIDLQEVVSALGDPRRLIMEDRHVVISREVVHAGL